MSRGGRGGGRGGRGGARGGRPNVPWDTGDEPDARPSELFPPYAVPNPRPLTTSEADAVHFMLLLRHQIHSSALYTSKRSSVIDPTAPRKTYGQAQMNALYGVKNKASLDPFTAMPSYSQKFVREERALPDWSGRPICRELFPDELLDTIDSATTSSGGVRKKRKLELKIGALPSAEEAFGMPALGGPPDRYEIDAAVARTGAGAADDGSGRALLDRLEALREEDGEDGAVAEVDDEEGGAEEDDEDEVYDDEDAGDYDAENYFENGDEGDDDYGDGGDDGEGTY